MGCCVFDMSRHVCMFCIRAHTCVSVCVCQCSQYHSGMCFLSVCLRLRAYFRVRVWLPGRAHLHVRTYLYFVFGEAYMICTRQACDLISSSFVLWHSNLQQQEQW